MQLTALEKTIIITALEDYVNADNYPGNIKIAYDVLDKLEKDLLTTQD